MGKNKVKFEQLERQPSDEQPVADDNNTNTINSSYSSSKSSTNGSNERLGSTGTGSTPFCSPSCDICRNKRGVIELILRALSVISSVLTVICASMTIYNARHFHDANGGSLALNTLTGAGWLALVSLIIFVTEIVIMIGRFLNCGCTITRYTCCYALGICLNMVMALFILCGAIAMAVYSEKWPFAKIINVPDEAKAILEYYRSQAVVATGATAAFSFLNLFVIAGLVVWLIISLCMKKASTSSGEGELTAHV